MSFQVFKENFNIPAILIKLSNSGCCQVEPEFPGQVDADLPGQVKRNSLVSASRKKVVKSNGLSTITILAAFALLYAGSATEKKTTTPLAVASYDFSPPSTAPAKSSKVAFLLLDPMYAHGFQYSSIKVFSEFSKSMSADFNELLVAKGYSVRGPYSNYDAIVYSDKKESDLMLEVEIDLSMNTSNIVWKANYIFGYPSGKNVFTFTGDVILSGKVNLTASETITKEKLWAKSIPLAQKSVTVRSEKTYSEPNDWFNALTQDPGMVNSVNALDDFYTSVFNKTWIHIEPQELTPLKKQVDEIPGEDKILSWYQNIKSYSIELLLLLS